MDPLSLIVLALATGAAAGLKPTAEAAVRDAYQGLKRLITDRYRGVDVSPLEQRPESDAKRRSLEEDLRETTAADDHELLVTAKALLELVASHDPAEVVGVDLDRVRAAFIDIGRVTSSGTGVRGRDLTVDGGIRISEVDAGGQAARGAPNASEADPQTPF